MTKTERRELINNIEIAVLPEFNMISCTDSTLLSIFSKLTWDEAYYLRMLIKGVDYGSFDYNDYLKEKESEHNLILI